MNLPIRIGRWASIIGEQLGEAPIEISPLKVVCGQEPERTNLLLQKTWALVCQRSSVAAGAVANTTNGQGTPQTGQNGHKNSSGAVPGEEQSGAPLANEPESLLQSRRRSSEGARQRTEAFQKALAEMTSYKAEWLHSEEYKTAAHLEVPISLDEDSGSEVEDVTGEQECEESAGSPRRIIVLRMVSKWDEGSVGRGVLSSGGECREGSFGKGVSLGRVGKGAVWGRECWEGSAVYELRLQGYEDDCGVLGAGGNDLHCGGWVFCWTYRCPCRRNCP